MPLCFGFYSNVSVPDVDMATYVHEYYSVDRFKAAYHGSIPHMTDKSQWPQVDMGFKLLPPPLKRGPGREKKNRFKLVMNQDQKGNKDVTNVENLGIMTLETAL